MSQSKLAHEQHQDDMNKKLLINNLINSLLKGYPVEFIISCYPMEEVPYHLEQLIRNNIVTRDEINQELQCLQNVQNQIK